MQQALGAEPIALQGTSPAALAELAGIGLHDARRIVSLVHRTGELPARAPATVRRAALEAVRALGHVPSLEVVHRAASEVDPFVKLGVRLRDGAVVETVRIPLERPGRFSVCVSSQVGCALACAFCATGRMGLRRNLEAWEIVEQVRLVRADLGAPVGAPDGSPRVHGVLFQGMGEPLANLDRVLAAIAVLTEPSAQAIDARNITVCTAGLPSGIARLAREAPQVRLGVSLGSAVAPRRRSLMPIDDAHPLSEVLEAAGRHAQSTGHSPMFAYTLLGGRNDSDDDACALATLVRDFATRFGARPRLSLIPFNEIEPGSSSDSPSPSALVRSSRLERFRDVLAENGAGGTLRYSGGGDVRAACGQLATATGGRTSRAALDPAPRTR